MQQRLDLSLKRTSNFVYQGITCITGDKPVPSAYLVSAAPVPTALALLALAAGGRRHIQNIRLAASYLKSTFLTDAGWGNTPAGPSRDLATAICSKGLAVLEPPGISPQLIHDAACLVAKTWTQDFDRLAPGWLPKQNSPLIKLLEAISGKTLVPTLETLTLRDFKTLSHFMPPYGRPTMLAVTLIKDWNRRGRDEETMEAAEELAGWVSADGSWCEDVVVTSMAVMALSLAGFRQPLDKACDWLSETQYDHGGWPSFNQLTNWAVGWAAQILGGQDPHIHQLTTPYLFRAINQDGSLGTTPPYSYPDLDDTAIGLLGLLNDPSASLVPLNRPRQMLLKLQNGDGSWGTFPSFSGLPPDCSCGFPVYIKSGDVTVHVLQALLKMGLPESSLPVTKALGWLTRRQHADGTWDSTWFLGQTYATAQILDLLLDLKPESEPTARGIDYLLTAQKDGRWDMGSAGETGLALYTLLKAGTDPHSTTIVKGLDYLLSLQSADGSFRPFYCGFYASGLYYEEPLSEAMAALRAMDVFLKLTQK